MAVVIEKEVPPTSLIATLKVRSYSGFVPSVDPGTSKHLGMRAPSSPPSGVAAAIEGDKAKFVVSDAKTFLKKGNTGRLGVDQR